jgi:ribosome-associated protein
MGAECARTKRVAGWLCCIFEAYLAYMTKRKTTDPQPLALCAVEALKDVKGHDIVLMDMREVPHAITDMLVIADGSSRTQVEALARSVEEEAEALLGERPWHIHGLRNGEWVILDYSNVVVHIFHEAVRGKYALEELWGDAELKALQQV